MKSFTPVRVSLALGCLWLSLVNGLSCRAGSAREAQGSQLYQGDGKAGESSGSSGGSRLQQGTAATAAPARCPSALNIVGGKAVSEDDLVAGATVKIWIRNQKFCSATLLGPQQIVTAAHCFKDVQSADELRLGFGLAGTVDSDVKVKGFKIHPEFTGVTGDDNGLTLHPLHDVAVVTFEGTLGEGARPVALATSENLYPGIPALVAGYGSYSTTDKTRRNLTQVELEIASIRTDLRELQLKTGDAKGACFGDSGGPTFIKGEQGQCLLLAGSTTGPGRGTDLSCESGGGTLMDLTRYRTWIQCTLAQLGSPLSPQGDEEAESCRSE